MRQLNWIFFCLFEGVEFQYIYAVSIQKLSDTFVRPAQPEDIPFIIDCQISMARETEGMELKMEEIAPGVSAVFGTSVAGEYYIAEKTDSTTGVKTRLGCLLTLLEWSDWRNGNVIWIHSVYIDPDYRRHGIFSKMYDYLKVKVQQSGGKFRGLRLYVDHRNEKAKKTYLKLGMNQDHYALFEWMA